MDDKSRHRLPPLCRGLVVAAAVAGLAGCVGMPNSGPVGVAASPQTSVAGEDFIGPIPVGPEPNWDPSQIVSGFLAASASYPTFAEITKQYLVSSAARAWNPGWQVTVFRKLNPPDKAVTSHHEQQATVGVSGTVQATFNNSGEGEFVSPQKPRQPTSPYTFDLVRVNGQWRITNPPQTRLLTQTEFSDYYKPQDLYFLSTSGQDPVLVPDSVFVPVGASATTLATNLVTALLQGPKGTWLQNATSSFLPGTTLLGVTIDGSAAVVNLGGAAGRASAAALVQMSAQLLWTLAAPQPGLVPSPIQSVELEVNGEAFVPPGTICGVSQSQSPVQKQASYSCYDPYPPTQASFSFLGNGTAWSRCGSQQKVAAGDVGALVPVLGRTGRVLGVQPCQGNGSVSILSTYLPPGQPRLTGTPTELAVSPDGEYLAYVTPGKGGDTVSIRAISGAAGWQRTLSGIKSLCWDNSDDLWFVQDGTVWMASATGESVAAVYQGSGTITRLSVAPDGARIALIVQNGTQQQLELAAINRGGQSVGGQRGSATVHIWLVPGVQLAPNLTEPVALTWYDADNLLVLASESNQNLLYEVPVDGQQSSGELLTPPGAISIAAYGHGNALVAGLSDGGISVSASLQGPWQPLGVRGADPAYPG